ncbi:MAG: methyltransferase [Sporomusa sp.]|jgi:DNA adenine methylase|nr:methyltransferase [Sporomusa sp.]
MAEPVLRWPGSKWRLSDWIVSRIPPHEVYVEPFFGSGAIFFSKKPSETETINDLDGNVVNLFKTIRENSLELAALIEMTPWSRAEYNYVRDNEPTGDPLEDARRFLVRCWQGFGAKTSCRTGWAFDRTGTVYKPQLWQKLPKRILDIADRLKNAQIECLPGVELIKEHNRKNTLIYVDPPYIVSTRRNSKLYAIEMGEEKQHIELLTALNNHQGPAIISGYPSKLYSDALEGWEMHTNKARTEKGIAATEVIWLNPKAAMYTGGLF